MEFFGWCEDGSGSGRGRGRGKSRSEMAWRSRYIPLMRSTEKEIKVSTAFQ